MDQILERIQEIEETGEKILAEAGNRKKAYGEEMKKKTEEFDKNLEVSTQKQLEKIREDMHKKMEEQVESQRRESRLAYEKIERSFNKYHREVARRIVKEIVGE